MPDDDRDGGEPPEGPARATADAGTLGTDRPPNGDEDEHRPRVLIAVERRANREQLGAWLSERYAVETMADRPARDAFERCDLWIADGASFARHREALATRRAEGAPVFYPTLLVLTEGTPGALPAETWRAIDDVIATPVRQAELRGRIEVLLRARRYSVDLQRQNERLEQFANIVAHDLRNPLAIALGFLDAVREGGDPDDLARVERALDRMEEIIDDVLTLARTGTVVEERAPIDLVDAAETAWKTVVTGRAALEIEVEPSTTVTADESRLIELFENLFRNAVEHGSTSSQPAADDAVEHGSTSPDSQTRRDAVEHGSTSSQPAADDAVEHGSRSDRADSADAGVTVRVGTLAGADGFYVEDDGPGVPEADRERIFEYGHTTADGGTGFGLSIVRGIVEAHGWSIRLVDGRDGGARFEVSGESTGSGRSPPTTAATDADE